MNVVLKTFLRSSTVYLHLGVSSLADNVTLGFPF
jgi:hypothetical protein